MFACKNCGGNVKFDIKSGQLACDYCHSLFDPYAYEDKTSDAEVQKDFEATIFTCPQCGGEILSTDDTAAGFCSFCGASTVLYSRMQKEHKPTYIIPFEKSKDDCKQAYMSLMKKAIFAPKELKDPKFIDGFRGIYMPYWTYYVAQKTPISLPANKSHRSGDYIITDHFRLEGDLDAYYKGLSYDASSSFDDSISEKLAPYDVKNMKRFTPAYLSGFYADTADLPSTVYANDAMDAAYTNTINEIGRVPAFTGFSVDSGSAAPTPLSLGTTVKEADYSMFPVWFLSYRNKDRVAYATVNGQTGKVVADLPISIGKFLLGSLIAAIPVYILLCMLTVLTPGMTLTIVGILAIVANLCYSQELTMIAIKEAGAEDKGRIAKEQPEALGAIDNRRRLKAAKKATKGMKKKTNTSLTAYFILFIFVIQFIPALFSIVAGIRSDFGNADGSFILFAVLTIVSFVFSIRAFSSFDRMPGHKGIAGLIFGMVSMLFGDAVLFIQPVLDAWYYGAAFIIIASVLITLINVIRAFNVLTTRRLPQFATHKGGDDRA